MIRNVADIAAAVEDGRYHAQQVFKPAFNTTGAGRWYDRSIGAGTPNYNAYIGNVLEFTPLVGQRNLSIYAGPTPGAGMSKHLLAAQMRVGAANQAPLTCLFADYLGFYPLIDGDSVDPQATTNTASLTRYATGDGVQAFVVVQVPGTLAATATCTVSYTNHAGTSGRTSTFSLYGSGVIGTCVSVTNTSSALGGLSPFIPLQSGDRGIRSIESVTLSAAIGGFVNIVLCKPLFMLPLWEGITRAERNFGRETMPLPKIEDGCYLQWLALAGNTTGESIVHGQLEFIWG